MQKNSILSFLILTLVPFIMVLGNSMLIPIFPLLKAELSLSPFQVGLFITAFSIPAGIIIPFAGALSDHLSRKAIMFPALLLYGTGGLISGLAALLLENPFLIMIIGRVVQGIGAGGTYQIALALTGDLYQEPKRAKAVGALEAANGLGKVVSPIAGSALGLIVWFAPFFVYGLVSIPIAFAVWFLVKEPKNKRKKQSIKEYCKSLRSIFSKKGIGLTATYFTGAVGLFLLFGLLSFISDDLETKYSITGILVGLILAIPVTTMSITTFLTGFILQSKKKLLLPTIATGLSITTVGFICLAIFESLIPLIVIVSLMGFGIGTILPVLNIIITSACRTAERGLVTAIYGTVRFFGVALGPPAFGLALGLGRLAMFISGAVIAGLALAVVLIFVRPQKIIVEEGSN